MTIHSHALTVAIAVCLLTTASQGADSIEDQYLGNVRQVTHGFVKAGEGYFSPDGGTIIYQAVPQGYPFYQIYTQSLTGGTPKLISTGRPRKSASPTCLPSTVLNVKLGALPSTLLDGDARPPIAARVSRT